MMDPFKKHGEQIPILSAPTPKTPIGPWVWPVLLVSNFLLAYAPLSLDRKLWIGLMGILLPLGFGVLNALSERGSRTQKGWNTETFTRTSPWDWLMAGVVAVLWVLRLLQVHWPVADEGVLAAEAVDLADHWRWKFFYTPAQHPPFFFWSLALYFRVLPPSLLSIRLFPLLWTAGAILLAYGTARSYFSRSLSLMIFLLAGLSFCSFYTGRICGYMAPLLFWEVLVLWAFGWILRSRSLVSPALRVLVLSLLTALGFGWAIAWPLAAFAVGSAFFIEISRQNPKVRLTDYFAGPVLIALLIWVIASFGEKNGQHILALLGLRSGAGFLRQLLDSFSNLTGLFWGCDLQNSYGPVWGGMLNPFLGTFFFMGVILLLRSGGRAAFWIGGTFLAFLLPGLLTANFDMFRNTLAFPFLLVIVALGLQEGLSKLPASARLLGLVGVLLISTTLDWVHLDKTYETANGSNASPLQMEMTKAYRTLDRIRQKEGPGWLLLDLTPGLDDQTLAMAAYPFNGFLNPSISIGEVHWAAVIMNADLQPFLQQRFPEASFVPLFSEAGKGALPERPWTLMTLSLTRQTRADLEAWRQTAQTWHGFIAREFDQQAIQAHQDLLEGMSQGQSGIPQDPFLRSCYWGWIYQEHNWLNGFGDHDTKRHFPDAFHALQMAVQEGYPTAYFYNELGTCYALMGDRTKARWAFEKAVHAPLDLTPAKENLKALEETNKDRKL